MTPGYWVPRSPASTSPVLLNQLPQQCSHSLGTFPDEWNSIKHVSFRPVKTVGKMWRACKEMFIFSLALKLLNSVNSGSFVQCDYYSIPEVNVSCVLFVRWELSEGGSCMLAFLSVVTYRKQQWMRRSYAWQLLDHCSLCIFWDLLNTCLFPLLKFLHVTLVDWISSNPSQNTGYCVVTAPWRAIC